MKYFILLLVSFELHSATSRDVFIRGKIGNVFDEKSVTVIDNYNQKYILPRSAFPKEFVPKQGKSFAIEVDESLLDDVKITSYQ